MFFDPNFGYIYETSQTNGSISSFSFVCMVGGLCLCGQFTQVFDLGVVSVQL
jgi:hypothetical protein